MRKIPFIANTAVRCFFVFIIAYLWLSYLVSSWLLAIFLSALVTLAVNAAIVAFTRRNSAAHTQTKAQAEHMQKTILQLKFLKPQQTLALFKTALCEKCSCIITTRKLTVKTSAAQIELFSLFHKDPTISDIIECHNAANKKGVVSIAAETFTPQIKAFVSNLKTEIKLLDGASVYREILSPANVFPEFSVETKSAARRTLSQIKKTIFSPARTKGYVFTAIVIFATSFLVRLSLFYIIIATAVFTLAIISRFGERENTKLFEFS